MLSVFHAIPFELQRKPPMATRWDPTLGTPRGDKYYNQYRPLCEGCPRDHSKVVESLQGAHKVSVFCSIELRKSYKFWITTLRQSASATVKCDKWFK